MLRYRDTELLALLGPRAERAEEHRMDAKHTKASPGFPECHLVLVSYREVFKEVGWPPFKAKMYGP